MLIAVGSMCSVSGKILNIGLDYSAGCADLTECASFGKIKVNLVWVYCWLFGVVVAWLQTAGNTGSTT